MAPLDAKIAMYRKLYVAITLSKMEGEHMFTTTTVMALLAVLATLTSLLTQGVKMFLDDMKIRYASNIVVLVISLVIGCGGTALYCVNQQIPFNALTAVYLAIMGIGNWLAAMLGYDKVKQVLTQIGETGRG